MWTRIENTEIGNIIFGKYAEQSKIETFYYSKRVKTKDQKRSL